MKILGIDYGRKKIGLAVADDVSKLAEPLRVIRFATLAEAIKKVGQMLQDEQVDRVVIGISEGEMAKETRDFGRRLSRSTNVDVVYQDETLTTQDAQNLSITANIKRKKRKDLEDAYAAALILQTYFGL